MKKLFLILVTLLGALPLFSKTSNTVFNKEHMNVSVHSRYQLMLNTHGIYNDMLNSYSSVLTGVQVGFDTHQSDNNWWSKAYNYPSLALGFSYDNVGAMNMKPGTNLGTNQVAAGAKLKYYLAPQQTDKKIRLEKPGVLPSNHPFHYTSQIPSVKSPCLRMGSSIVFILIFLIFAALLRKDEKLQEKYGSSAHADILQLLCGYQHVFTHPYRQWIVHSPFSSWWRGRSRSQ